MTKPVVFTDTDLETIARVALCRSSDAMRYQLTGVCLRQAKDNIHVIATDGRQIAIGKLDHERIGATGDEALVPNNVVAAILKAYPKKNGKLKPKRDTCRASLSVEWEEGGSAYFYSGNGTRTEAPLVQGVYPDISSLGPKPNKTLGPNIGTLDPEILLQAQSVLCDNPVFASMFYQDAGDKPGWRISPDGKVCLGIMPLMRGDTNTADPGKPSQEDITAFLL